MSRNKMKMSQQNKPTHFQTFLTNWQNEFKQIPYILDLISSYPEINKHFEDIDFLSNDEFIQSQQEWVALVAKFEHPLDKDFFKPCWVPIEKDGYDYFIDLSSGTYSIFQIIYYPFEPYGWIEKYVFHDVSLLFQSLEDDSINLEEELEENEIDYFNSLGDLQIKRKELGFAGEIPPPEFDADKFHEDTDVSSVISGNKLTIKGVTPYVISLLPYKSEIKLLNFTVDKENRVAEYQGKVNNIQAFLFLLVADNYFVINSVEFLFVPLEIGSVKWENNKLEIIHSKKSILNHIQTILQNNQILND